MSRNLLWAWDRKEKACTVCKQKSVVRILSSPVYRLCDLGSYEPSCPVKQGFGITTSQAHWEAQMREPSQKFLYHPPLCWLVLSVLMLGGKVTGHSQVPTSAQLWRLKTPGVAGAQVPPSLISGDLKPWGRQPRTPSRLYFSMPVWSARCKVRHGERWFTWSSLTYVGHE